MRRQNFQIRIKTFFIPSLYYFSPWIWMTKTLIESYHLEKGPSSLYELYTNIGMNEILGSTCCSSLILILVFIAVIIVNSSRFVWCVPTPPVHTVDTDSVHEKLKFIVKKRKLWEILERNVYIERFTVLMKDTNNSKPDFMLQFFNYSIKCIFYETMDAKCAFYLIHRGIQADFRN